MVPCFNSLKVFDDRRFIRTLNSRHRFSVGFKVGLTEAHGKTVIVFRSLTVTDLDVLFKLFTESLTRCPVIGWKTANHRLPFFLDLLQTPMRAFPTNALPLLLG